MNTRILQHSLEHLSSYIPMAYPAACWFWTDAAPPACIQPQNKKWSCAFGYFNQLVKGHRICFSADRTGCSGAACYFGYKAPSRDAGRFLAEREKFKKNSTLGDAFYEGICAPLAGSRYLVWETVETIVDSTDVEVVNLWIDAEALPDLVTLANYDHATNNNVAIPFAAGCQSIWTLPYKEKSAKEPMCVVGCMDPAMRKYLPGGVLSFSMPADRLVEMASHVSDSFLSISDKKP